MHEVDYKIFGDGSAFVHAGRVVYNAANTWERR